MELQKYAMETHTRVSIVSGDVHCSAVGVLKTLVREKKRQDVPPANDPRYMLNIVTSELFPLLHTWISADY